MEGDISIKQLIYSKKKMVFRGQTTDTARDRPNGVGRLEMENGDFYEGEFHLGKFHGQGRLMQKSGKMYEGGWKENRREGKGKELWPDGKLYEGNFEADQKCGYGKFAFKKHKGHFSGRTAAFTMGTL